MAEAPKNGNELSHSAHANGMNKQKFLIIGITISILTLNCKAVTLTLGIPD
jgi:hypothetical protein